MRAAADFFHGDKPDLEAIFSGDYSGFMAWRERHGAATVLPDAQRVRSQGLGSGVRVLFMSGVTARLLTAVGCPTGI